MEMFGPALGAVTTRMSRDEWGRWTVALWARVDSAQGQEWEECLLHRTSTREEAALVLYEALADLLDTVDLAPWGEAD